VVRNLIFNLALPCENDIQTLFRARNIELEMANQYAHILPPSWKLQVTAWLAEDTPSFDYAGFVVGEAEREAFLFGKGNQRAILAGCPFFTEVFEQLGCL